MRHLFDVHHLPKDTPIEWAQAVNSGVRDLKARKVTIITYDEPTHLGYCCRWVSIFLQAHIRRGLSLLESGSREIKKGRPLVAALCSRALLEEPPHRAAIDFAKSEAARPSRPDRDRAGSAPRQHLPVLEPLAHDR
jgi:hypothetical protein